MLKKSTTIVLGSSTRSCMSRSKIREAQKRANSMGTATGVVFLPQSLANTGVLPLISASFWFLSACRSENGSQTHGFLQHWLSEAKALFRKKLARKWGHAIARGWATLLLDRLRDFVVVPFSAGGNSSFELHSQSMEECATLDRYHHFHGDSGMCA